MNFASDNTSGIAPEILAALVEANHGPAMSYGADPISERLEQRLTELFERPVAVFAVATGTSANSLALACLTPPWGVVYCHPTAHINTDECGAPEFFTGGGRLVPLDGEQGKLHPAAILAAIAGQSGNVHHAQPAVVSLTQATEAGTVYTPDEIGAIAEVARDNGLGVHMDGARFANAVASLDVSPAEITWRAGVDVLSLGATKNGALAAEAVVFFDPAQAAEFAFRRKRAGHLFSKMRFLSAQLDAYLADGLWLRLARHANEMAARLADGLAGIDGCDILYPVEANEIFLQMPADMAQGLTEAGFVFYRRPGARPTVRLVTSFDTAAADVDGLIATAAELASEGLIRA